MITYAICSHPNFVGQSLFLVRYGTDGVTEFGRMVHFGFQYIANRMNQTHVVDKS